VSPSHIRTFVSLGFASFPLNGQLSDMVLGHHPAPGATQKRASKPPSAHRLLCKLVQAADNISSKQGRPFI